MWKDGKGSFLPPAFNVGSKLFRRSGSVAPASEGTRTGAPPHSRPKITVPPRITPSLAKPDQLAQVPSSQNTSRSIAEKGWEGLKIALRILEKASKAFPPLEMTVGGLIVAIDVIEVNTSSFIRMLNLVKSLIGHSTSESDG
jgi:hypothetical protein